MIKLYSYQQDCINFCENKKVAYLAIPCGGGKTLTSLMAVQSFKTTLIICPASLCQLWADEINKWFVNQPIQILKTTKENILPHMRYLIMSYEKACSPNIFKQLIQYQYDSAIVDEAHRIKNPLSKRTEALIGWQSNKPRILKKSNIQKILFLSGTPMMQRPIELWPVLKSYNILPEKWNYYSYGIHFCCGYKNDWKAWVMNGANNLEELAEICKDFMVRVPKAVVEKELPPVTQQIIRFDIAQDLVEKEKTYALDSLDVVESVGFEGLSELRHLMAIQKVNHVLPYIIELTEQMNKCIIFAWHKTVLSTVAEALLAKDVPPVKLDGSVPPHLRLEKAKEFNDSDKAVALCQIKSVSEGLSLHTADCVIFLESSWNPADNEQALKRAHRKGQINPLNVKYLVIKNSFDNYILQKVLTKEANVSIFNEKLEG